MKYFKFFPFLLLSVLFVQLSPAQEKKPKVAVVLSGGGARGIAHIYTLQMLDSLGVVPDLIIGTSMGSVVGGLYAMGYSGNEIEELARTTDWESLFSGTISLRDISNEEKSEYNQYLVDFDFVKGKPKVSSAIISDQNLREYFHSLTFSVYDVKDFDDLAIPYRAMATDIVNGKEVVLSSGSLNFAMRASMSIPGVFMPLDYNETLLVDGGVLNNFPVDVAKRMGADIIIGSDVGGGMKPKEKLDNIGSLLFQTGMLSSNLKNPGNRALCDILIDHVPYLTYETGDFAKATEIYEEGKIGTLVEKQKFIELAERLKGFPQTPAKRPDVKDEFFIENITYTGISEEYLQTVKSRANFKTQTNYTTSDIKDGIDKIVGTNFFEIVSYDIKKDENDKLVLEISAVEQSKHQVKGGLHYDSYNGIGLILNYTGRNVLGNSSRLLLTLDIAEQQRGRLQYQKIFGEKRDWWSRAEAYTENLDQDFVFEGQTVDEFRYRYSYGDLQFNKNINSFKSFVGLGLLYEFTRIVPKADPDIVDNFLGLEDYRFNNFSLYAQYNHNSFDRAYFPTKGVKYKAMLSRSLYNEANVNYIDESIGDFKKPVNGFTKFTFDFEKRLSISESLTGIAGADVGFTFYDDLKSDEVDFADYAYGAKYYLGGVLTRPRRDNFVLPGLLESELAVNQFMMVELALQYNFLGLFYLKPHVNFGTVGFSDFNNYIEDAFSPDGNWKETIDPSSIFTAGVTTSIDTFLGPIDFDLSYTNDISKIRFFIGVGYQLNRSN
ncbi:patatin-like phospholipase family protein [Namhaeicola litoreus]|uniref:Patatin-like phospholipase family protein n=1 Tax=Namhaeicola litoreus TaxID=1052145 RepID=A0ABW3Y0W7_9FLAO